MAPILREAENCRIERLCGHSGTARGGRIRVGSGADGIERLEAFYMGEAFSPHRHDTYAIGITVSGVQTFRYRGEQRYCLPGQCHVLHPDELHDGRPATGEGFGYRIVYLDPGLIQEAIGSGPLPFVPSPVVESSLLPQGFPSGVWDMDAELDDVSGAELVAQLADLLLAASSRGPAKSPALDVIAVSRVRDLIAARPSRRCSMDALERVSGLDRWTLARQFRAAFGTSPSRFRILRQLDHVRRLLTGGVSLAHASADAGFADQSHMSRRFKSAYGLTPGGWVAAVNGMQGMPGKAEPLTGQPRARRVVR